MTKLSLEDLDDLEYVLGDVKNISPGRVKELTCKIANIRFEMVEFERRQKEEEERRSQVAPL